MRHRSGAFDAPCRNERRSGRNWVCLGLNLVLAMLLSAMLALTGCGAGDSGESDDPNYDRNGATLKVGEGLTLLETTLSDYIANTDPTAPFPYPGTVNVGDLFGEAVTLDPTYDQAGFWAAVFELISFLQSAETQAFLAKLGWQDLTTPTDGGYEFGDFTDRIGQTYDETLGVPDPAAPPMNGFYLPTDPEWEDDQNPSYNPIILAGTDDYVDVRFDELHAIVTQGLAGSARRAVNRLKDLPPDFSTSITVSDGETFSTFTLDRFEAKLLQGFYGLLELVSTLPSLWTFPDLDAFISDSSIRNPQTGDIETDLDGLPIDDITNAELVGYIRNGHNGGALPLAKNPAGVSRFKQALADLLEAVESAFGYLVDATDMSGHPFDLDLVFGTYTDEPAVMRYSMKAGRSMAAEARAALTLSGGRRVNVYRPVAFIQDFSNTCTVGGTSTADPSPGNLSGTGLPATLDFITADAVIALGAMTTDPQVLTQTVPEAMLFNGDLNAYYFSITLDAPMNLSIYTTTADALVDTKGDVGFVTDTGTGAVTWWDSDADSGADLNFGMSIDADWFNVTDMTTAPATLVIRVEPVTTGEFTLHVVAATDGNWPNAMGLPTEPIFLKGGGGRNFRLETWQVGGVKVNLAAVVDAAADIFNIIDRSQFDLFDDGMGGTTMVLMADKGVLRNRITAVFPEATFPVDSPILGSGQFDLTQPMPAVEVPGIWPLSPSTPVASFGTLGFCANPKDLTRSAEHAGGFTPLF